MPLAWIALSAFVALALALDLRGHGAAAIAPRAALAWSLAWTALGLAFAVPLALFADGGTAGAYLAGFLIEKSLSLDNLFVFAVLFAFFRVPAAQRNRVLLLGVAGAIVLRTAFILAGAAALDAFAATTYLLGALLALTAVKIARQGEQQIDPDRTLAMRALRRVVPISRSYDGGRLLTRAQGGRRMATPLLAALAMVAAFDVMFAVDSIPAIFAITRDTFVVFAANAFSLLGMVSLYFLLEGMLDRFRHLNLGLAAILAFVAAKLLLADVWHPPVVLSLAVVLLALGAAARASGARVGAAQERRVDVRDPRQQLHQRLGAARADVLGDELGGRAGRRLEDPCGQRRQLGAGGARLRVRVGEQLGEARVDRGAALERVPAGAQHLDHERAREGRLGGEDLEECLRPRAHPRLPRARVRDGLDRGEHLLEQQLGARLPCGQEAGALVREVLVERLARDARAGDHLPDRRRGVAVLGDARRHRLEQPAALRREHDLARRGVAAARERARDGRGAGHGNEMVQ
jgi:tellurite resistance protein TerC